MTFTGSCWETPAKPDYWSPAQGWPIRPSVSGLQDDSLWPACVSAHSSLRSPENRRSWQSLLFSRHRTGSWSQMRTPHLGWSCTSWRVCPGFLSWGPLPCQGAGHRQPWKKGRVRLERHQCTGAQMKQAARPYPQSQWFKIILKSITYHLLPLKQAVRHELPRPYSHGVILQNITLTFKYYVLWMAINYKHRVNNRC